MKKKFMLVIIVSISVFFEVFGEESQIEMLWQKCMENNYDIKIDEIEFNLAKFRKEKDNDKGGVSQMVLNGRIDFPRDNDNGVEFKPLRYDESITFTKNITSSTALGFSLRNKLTNEYKILKKNKYNQDTSFSLTLIQSLAPYWLQGYKGNSFDLALKKNSDIKEKLKRIDKKKIIQSLTNCYIQARYYFRYVENTKEIIGKYSYIIGMLEDRVNLSHNEKLSLDAYRKTQWEYIQNLNDYISNFSDLKLQIDNYCNQKIDFCSIMPLPECNLMFFDDDIEIKEIDDEIEYNELERVNDIQAGAPSLTLDLGVNMNSEVDSFNSYIDSFGEEKNYSWYIAINFDLSSFVSSAGKIKKEEFKNKIDGLVMKKNKIINEKKHYKNYFNYLFKNAKYKYEYASELLDDYENEEEQLLEIYKNGMCSEVDIIENDIKVLDIKSAKESIEDELWYYKWMQYNL